MKTQEEIEQLAFLKYPRLINDPYNPMEDDNAYERQIWIDAYIQCQEDMFNSLLANKLRSLYGNADKKYTEEDIRKAIQVGISTEAGDHPEGFNYKLGITLEDYFIKSLNKQD
jgi:hypothetical protein